MIPFHAAFHSTSDSYAEGEETRCLDDTNLSVCQLICRGSVLARPSEVESGLNSGLWSSHVQVRLGEHLGVRVLQHVRIRVWLEREGSCGTWGGVDLICLLRTIGLKAKGKSTNDVIGPLAPEQSPPNPYDIEPAYNTTYLE